MNQFNALIDEFPDSDLADDALLNTGICYYAMNQFEKINQFQELWGNIIYLMPLLQN